MRWQSHRSNVLWAVLALVVVVSGAISPAPAWMRLGNATAQTAPPQVAYIYSTDLASRDAFAAYLVNRGYVVDLVALGNVATFNFAPDRAIIVGDDTGSLSTWGTQAAVDHVTSSNKPVLGVGEGGYAFFGRLALAIGWGNGWHIGPPGQAAATVVNAADTVWSTPNVVPGVTTGSNVGLYSTGSSFVAIFNPTPIPGVTRIGRQTDDASHYPLISQGGCYFLWGFSSSPTTMTPAGKDLFENALLSLTCGGTTISGIAECGTGLLGGAQVELFSGTSLVASTIADPETAAYAFFVASGEYTVRITKGAIVCGGTGNTDGTTTVEAPLDLHNHSWPAAYLVNPLATGGLPVPVDEHIFRQDQSAWFKFRVQPGSKVIVTLTKLPENYDLTLYKDIGTAYKTLTSPTDLARLGAEFAPDAFSPDAFSPDAFSPDAFSPDAFSPDAFSPDAFSPDAFSPDAFSPDAFSPDAFSPDAFSPDAFSPDAFSPDAFSPDAFSPDAFSPDAFSGGETVSPSAFASAQTRSLIAVSAFNGTASEGVLHNTWDNDTYFYVRVRGRNGAFSLAAPFHLEITQLTGSCAPVAPITGGSTLSAVAGNYKTLVLTDYTRLVGSATEIAALKAQLAAFVARSEIAGRVVDVSADGRVSLARNQAVQHKDCPYAENLLAAEIKRIVDAYRAVNAPLNQGGYIVLIGNDDVIPFFRHPDQAGLANEKGYVPPVLDTSASQASLKLGFMLGQDRYGTRIDLSRSDHTFPLPDLAVGRLIETAADATALLAAYQSTSGGVVPTPKSALVTGYDFLADAAGAIQSQFGAGLGSGGTVDALIEPGKLPPTDPLAWTAGDLNKQLLGKRHDLVFLGGHFSAVSALAADYTTRLLSTDVCPPDPARPGSCLPSAVDLTNAIIFSEGCHSGYNVVDADAIPKVTLMDIPQALAKRRATVIAGTGYQYGDTDTIEYGERLYLEFSKQLRTGTGAVSVGRALVAAKRAYLATTLRLTGIHEKTLVESTLYGLPMLSVNMPGARLPQPSDGSIVGATSAYTTNPGLTLGLQRADVSVNPALTTNTVPLIDTSTGSSVSPAATYLSGGNGVVTNPGEPIVPLEVRNATVPAIALRGVGFRGATYTDTSNVRPLTGATATELRTPHAPFFSGVFYPVRPWSVNYFDAVAGGATRLMLTPSQYVSTSPELGTRRVFGAMSLRLFYSNNTTTYGASATYPGNTPGLSAAPAISHVSAVPIADGNSVLFKIDVGGDPSAGVQEVWVTYTATSGAFAGQWQSLDLVRGSPSTRWVGTLPLPSGQSADNVRYMVQAVNGVGLVSLATNLGAYYIPGPDTVLPTAPKQPTTVSLLNPPSSAPYREQVTLRAALSSNGTPLGGRTLIFGIGAQRRLAVTDAGGNATVTLALLQTPGNYQASVAFQETPNLLSSSARSPFTITKRGTSLSLAPACGPLQATLRDTSAIQRTLRDQTVMFVAAGGSPPYATATITDFLGRATLNGLPLPDGNYTVSAFFGGIVNLGSQTVNLTDERYDGSTVNASLTLGDTSTSLIYTGETVIPANSTLDLATTISSTRSLAGAIVCYTVKNIDGAIVAIASGPVVGNTSTASATGLSAGVYNIESMLVGGSSATGFFTSSSNVSVAVFDAKGGYVTGGGWINSPPGAYVADPTQTGEATFAFVSSYLPGSNVPSGQTEFMFKAAGLRFQSSSYQWLVVAGARAQYKGSGTINGAGNYSFMLTAVDGQVSGGGGVDKFRIKIWDPADPTGKVIYDNQIGVSDTATPTTAIAGGSIVIHK